jgi:hypothetical protein
VFCVAGPVLAQPSPRPLSILDVPFISQSEALCGGAAAAMVLRYWGERGVDADSFAHLVDRSAAGIRTTTLVDALQRLGWTVVPAAGTDERLIGEMSRGRPVIALIEDRPGTFHYVVVVASTPRAIVFHDPARAPYRLMDRDRFARLWAASDHWMAVIVPAAAAVPAGVPADREPGSDDLPCDARLEEGIRLARANRLDEAERTLTSALSCGGAAPLRELAGLRLLQRRWPDVSELAASALDEDPRDAHAWELLATSRFVQSDPVGALEAWNRIDKPRVDLVAVNGLTRTRHRIVERLLNVDGQALLTPQLWDLSERRLADLPSASGTRLEYVPSASGAAELRAHVVERPLVPSDRWSYLGMALEAAARNEVAFTVGSITGGGETLTAGWRFWRGRPRGSLDVASPAPWGGLWGVDAAVERQSFDDDRVPVARRTGGGLSLGGWVLPWARLSGRGGVDAWDPAGTYGTIEGTVLLASPRERVAVEVSGSTWWGPERFATLASVARWRSRAEPRGQLVLASAGASVASMFTPPDLWFAGDTGRSRPIALRAHPLVDDGEIRVERLGRRILHGSLEAQRWWSTRSPIRVGAAVFADVAQVGDRLSVGERTDVDLGAGLRIAVPGVAGTFRLDVAKGLRDGATALSFVFAP